METLPAYTPDGTCAVGNKIFHRLFWVYQPGIIGFSFCKPIIQTDGTWLYVKYKGTLLMVVAQDGNNNIFPIAFALVEGDTVEGWSFFLRNLRLHIAPQPNLCLISERHPSIISIYDNIDNGWKNPPSTHVLCTYCSDFMREIKDKTLRKKIVNAGYALSEPSFKHYHEEIRLSNIDAVRWIDSIPLEK